MPPSVELLNALRDLIREEAGKAPSADRERPSGRALLIMLLVALNIALILTVLEELWKDSPLIRLLTKVVPFLFGAAFVALLDDIRHQLLKVCAQARFAWAMVSILVVLGMVEVFATVPAKIPVRMAAGGQLTVDGALLDPARDGKRIAEIKGFRPHVLVSTHVLPNSRDPEPIVDTVFVGGWDRVRATRIAQLVLGSYEIEASNLYPVAIKIIGPRSQDINLRITGTMTSRFRKRVAKHGGVIVDSIDVVNRGIRKGEPIERVWLTIPMVVTDVAAVVNLPQSITPYSLVVEADACTGTRVPLHVKAADNKLDFVLSACDNRNSGG